MNTISNVVVVGTITGKDIMGIVEMTQNDSLLANWKKWELTKHT